jgi:hypothetical protein
MPIKTFKPNPKNGDVEVRTVTALNTADELTKTTLKRIEQRPKEQKGESRTFRNGKWTDWKLDKE